MKVSRGASKQTSVCVCLFVSAPRAQAQPMECKHLGQSGARLSTRLVLLTAMFGHCGWGGVPCVSVLVIALGRRRRVVIQHRPMQQSVSRDALPLQTFMPLVKCHSGWISLIMFVPWRRATCAWELFPEALVNMIEASGDRRQCLKSSNNGCDHNGKRWREREPARPTRNSTYKHWTATTRHHVRKPTGFMAQSRALNKQPNDNVATTQVCSLLSSYSSCSRRYRNPPHPTPHIPKHGMCGCDVLTICSV